MLNALTVLSNDFVSSDTMTRILWILMYLLSFHSVPNVLSRLALFGMFILLAIVQPQFGLYLPTLAVALAHTPSQPSENDIRSFIQSRLIYTTALYVLIGLLVACNVNINVSSSLMRYLDKLPTDFSDNNNAVTRQSRIGYNGVEYGVFWYLNALMLSPLSVYFSCLVTMQSVVQANVIATLVSAYQMNSKSSNSMALVSKTPVTTAYQVFAV